MHMWACICFSNCRQCLPKASPDELRAIERVLAIIDLDHYVSSSEPSTSSPCTAPPIPLSWQGAKSCTETAVVVYQGKQPQQQGWAKLPDLHDLLASDDELCPISANTSRKSSFCLTAMDDDFPMPSCVFLAATTDAEKDDIDMSTILLTPPLPAAHHGISKAATGTPKSKPDAKSTCKEKGKGQA